MKPNAIIVCGVSGSGKSTIGQALAQGLSWQFFDADDFHPPDNIAKMAAGHPLNDADRAPWLNRLATLIREHVGQDGGVVLACSALKESYRDTLAQAGQVEFVFLAGTFDLIWQRMQQRENHFMKAEMLQSQFDTLEPPEEAFSISIANSVDKIISEIISHFELASTTL